MDVVNKAFDKGMKKDLKNLEKLETPIANRIQMRYFKTNITN